MILISMNHNVKIEKSDAKVVSSVFCSVYCAVEIRDDIILVLSIKLIKSIIYVGCTDRRTNKQTSRLTK